MQFLVTAPTGLFVNWLLEREGEIDSFLSSCLCWLSRTRPYLPLIPVLQYGLINFSFMLNDVLQKFGIKGFSRLFLTSVRGVCVGKRAESKNLSFGLVFQAGC